MCTWYRHTAFSVVKTFILVSLFKVESTLIGFCMNIRRKQWNPLSVIDWSLSQNPSFYSISNGIGICRHLLYLRVSVQKKIFSIILHNYVSTWISSIGFTNICISRNAVRPISVGKNVHLIMIRVTGNKPKQLHRI